MQTSIIKHSETISVGRIDAEFFHPDYMKIISKIQHVNPTYLADIIINFIHPMEIKRNYVEYENGIQFLRAQNIRPMMLEGDNNAVYISREDSIKLSNNNIFYNDILMTRTGANFGQCCIYLENVPLIGSSHTMILRTTQKQSYIMIFLIQDMVEN